MISRVYRADYEEIAGVLRALLVRLDDRLPRKDVTLIAEFIDVNELGVALEQIDDVLAKDRQPLAADERADVLALADRMQMGDRVPRVLSFCPEGDMSRHRQNRAHGGMSGRRAYRADCAEAVVTSRPPIIARSFRPDEVRLPAPIWLWRRRLPSRLTVRANYCADISRFALPACGVMNPPRAVGGSRNA
jgi:hypothetical protein